MDERKNRPGPGGDKHNIQLGVKGMTCAACAARVEKALASLNGVQTAAVNLATQSAQVLYDPEKTGIRDMRRGVEAAGYEVRALSSSTESLMEHQQRRTRQTLAKLKKRLVWAAIFTAPLLVLSMGHMIGLPLPGFLAPHASPLVFALVQFLLTVPVVVSGFPFYRAGFPNLWRAHPNMDSLIAVGTGAAMVYSTWHLAEIVLGIDPVAKAMDLYFESGAVIITLVTLGKFLETRSKAKTTEAIRGLMELAPDKATLIENGEQKTILAEEIRPGDLLLVKPGERIAVDGEIETGLTGIDESMLTGESLPVSKQPGAKVYGGSLNLTGAFRMRARKVGQDTVLARIVGMVQQAQGLKAPIAGLADRISLYFVPAVMGVAVVSSLAWLLAGQEFTFALRIFISVMVIACPCAMGLATPTAIMVATGRGAQLGVLIKSGQALETAKNVKTVVFDKTGTLTFGRPEMTGVHTLPGLKMSEDRLLALTAGMEQNSEHALARAVVQAAEKKNIRPEEPQSFEALPGRGVKARFEDAELIAGNAALMAENYVQGFEEPQAAQVLDKVSEQGETPLLVAVNGKAAAVLAISDVLKPEAPKVVDRLGKMGLGVIMLTGDTEKTARAIAERAGIARVISRVLPEQKADRIKELQTRGLKTAMVGDGINDAPALAVADVGLVMGTGIDVAVESGDIVLMRGELGGVITAFSLSRATVRNIKQNLFWAFAYNVLGIPVAAGLLYVFGGPTLSPMIAGAAMAMSSVSVVTNALRLKSFKPEPI